MTSTPRVIAQGQFSVLVCVVALSAVLSTAMAQRILARHPVLEAEIDTQAAVPTVPDVGSLHGDVELYAGGPGDDDEPRPGPSPAWPARKLFTPRRAHAIRALRIRYRRQDRDLPTSLIGRPASRSPRPNEGTGRPRRNVELAFGPAREDS